jgi:hypothetical protein
MTRLEAYKRFKKKKKIMFFVLMCCTITIIMGFIVVDYNVNSMLFADKNTRIISVIKNDDLVYSVKLMEIENILDFNYIKKDMENLMEHLKSLKCSR